MCERGFIHEEHDDVQHDDVQHGKAKHRNWSHSVTLIRHDCFQLLYRSDDMIYVHEQALCLTILRSLSASVHALFQAIFPSKTNS